MTLSLYEGRKRQGNWPFVLMAVNLLFSGACIFWWSIMAIVVADALNWATWGNVGRGAPDFLEYPFLLLWAVPLGGSCAAWSLLKADREGLALVCAWFPITLLGMIFFWFYLAPMAWR